MSFFSETCDFFYKTIVINIEILDFFFFYSSVKYKIRLGFDLHHPVSMHLHKCRASAWTGPWLNSPQDVRFNCL